MDLTEQELRGSVTIGYLKYVKKKWGLDGLKSAEEAVGIPMERINQGGFYPRYLTDRVLQWISENHGMDAVEDAGRYTIKNLGLFSFLVRFLKIETMIRKGRDGFKQAYKYGKMKIETGENEAWVRMKDVNNIKESCVGWQGALKGIMDLTKKKGTVEEVKCQLDGNEWCEYHLTWE